MNKQKADSIITEYLQKIYGFALKKSFSYEEAEDLCADIVQEVYRSLLKAEEILNVEGYIWRISEHTYSKYVSSKKKQEGISIDGMELPVRDTYDFENSQEEILCLRREIAFLTEKRRKIVYLFYYEDKTVAWIAKELGMPQGTVKWHLNKARNELKEGFSMERKIGKLGLSPITANSFGHSGDPGPNGGPEYYLGDKLNLNIVYSVYFEPKSREEIAEELGVTPVYIEDKINFLEGNGFLVPVAGNRYTTYVNFSPTTYSKELEENKVKKQLEVADLLVKEYVPAVRAAIADVQDVFIPGDNRELLEAAAIFYGIANKCRVAIQKDYSKYDIKTTAGGDFVACVTLPQGATDPDYKSTLQLPSYWTCGNMNRESEKYPAVYGWSIDSRLCTRKGGWQNNYTSDYEYVYEFLNGTLSDNAANAEKFQRLRERKYLTEDNQVNIMMVKGAGNKFFDKIPALDDTLKETFASFALEVAMLEAKNYPPQMQDLIIGWEAGGFVGNVVALMVMDILYGNGTFRPLTENEKVTSNLIMFSDILP